VAIMQGPVVDRLPGETDDVFKARQIANSPRGNFLIGKAIYNYLKMLAELPAERMPISDIADLELLMSALFPLGAVAGLLDDPANKDAENLKNVLDMLVDGLDDEEKEKMAEEISQSVGMKLSLVGDGDVGVPLIPETDESETDESETETN